ncbi:DUF6504 family protein [Phycicoccus sp. Soil803]|uniref:DUF6504 family protein n=1 Tax=Phycicoccus sp. Soil803 TaxID=1736415 RepID=UPI000A72BDB0|nr:DUF6504 family protein [Phycicoccus sp. Soil803]
MVRRYEETIEVREGGRDELTPGVLGAAGVGAAGGVGGGGAREPEAFVWRGRLYVVRAVLDRWQERRPWWRDARERDGGSDVLTDARERQVWRVEASAGRLCGVGVYDLGADHGDQWRLLRVAD